MPRRRAARRAAFPCAAARPELRTAVRSVLSGRRDSRPERARAVLRWSPNRSSGPSSAVGSLSRVPHAVSTQILPSVALCATDRRGTGGINQIRTSEAENRRSPQNPRPDAVRPARRGDGRLHRWSTTAVHRHHPGECRGPRPGPRVRARSNPGPVVPAWTLHELVGHLGNHYLWVRHNLGRCPRPACSVSRISRASPRRGWPTWLIDGGRRARRQARSGRSGSECWTWTADHRAGSGPGGPRRRP